jgi:hypothetical protein
MDTPPYTFVQAIQDSFAVRTAYIAEITNFEEFLQTDAAMTAATP